MNDTHHPGTDFAPSAILQITPGEFRFLVELIEQTEQQFEEADSRFDVLVDYGLLEMHEVPDTDAQIFRATELAEHVVQACDGTNGSSCLVLFTIQNPLIEGEYAGALEAES